MLVLEVCQHSVDPLGGHRHAAREPLEPPPGDLGAGGAEARGQRPGEQPAGTFTAFEFGNVGGEKIDYVLVQPATEVLHAEIVRLSQDRRYPSDHFPVVARIRLPN